DSHWGSSECFMGHALSDVRPRLRSKRRRYVQQCLGEEFRFVKCDGDLIEDSQHRLPVVSAELFQRRMDLRESSIARLRSGGIVLLWQFGASIEYIPHYGTAVRLVQS